jgi:TonB family protein
MRLPAALILACISLACISAFCQQTQAPLPEGVYRAGKGVTAPIIISKTDPQESEDARIAKISATILVSALVGTDGNVRDVEVTKSAGLGLDEIAIQTVRAWRFNPGVKDGMPVPVMVDIQFDFRNIRDSAWVLTRAVFNPPDGATRPVLTLAPYPPMYAATGQTGSVAISFDVNPNGIVENLHIENSSGPAAESEVIRIVRGWQFRPGMKDGQPISVRCVMEFIQGNVQ